VTVVAFGHGKNAGLVLLALPRRSAKQKAAFPIRSWMAVPGQSENERHQPLVGIANDELHGTILFGRQ
jgi:hypothetical protein